MSKDSRRCMILTEIGNEYTIERHIVEIDQDTTLTEMAEWVKSRDDHLEDGLRGKWEYARIYLLDNDDALSSAARQHVITVYAIRGRRGGVRYETNIERFGNFRSARNP
jgi:hypothetical protein